MEACRVPPAAGCPSAALWLMGVAALGMAVYVAIRATSNQRGPSVLRATHGHVRRARTIVHFVDADASFVDVAKATVGFVDGAVAIASDVSILDHGAHIANGNEVCISILARKASPQKATSRLLHFPSRFAVDSFRDALYLAKGNMVRPDAVTLALSTWNLGNAQPPSDISHWLNSSGEADIVAVGTQECSYDVVCTVADGDSQAAQSQMEGDTATQIPASSGAEDAQPSSTHGLKGKEHWQAMLHAHFSKMDYVNIIDIASWDRCLAVFAKRSVAHAVSRVRSDTAFVGIGGVAGNKGAIGVRFAVYDTEFVVVNSHLAAHQAEVHQRNEDFASIVGSLRALRDHPNLDLLSSTLHHVFWLGDLNYRVDLKREEVCQLVEVKDFGSLAKADQLGKAIRSGKAFLGFVEGELSFPPTYRFERGSRKYETTKMRVPSYTDRVLWHTLPGVASPKLQSYFSVDSILTSDHNPVVALFEAPLIHTTGVRKMEEIGEDVSRDEGLDGSPSQDIRKHACSRFDSGCEDMVSSFVLEFTKLSGRDLPAMDGTTQFLLSKLGSSLLWASPNALSSSSPTSGSPDGDDIGRGSDGGVSESDRPCLSTAGRDERFPIALVAGVSAESKNADGIGTDSGSGSTSDSLGDEDAATDDGEGEEDDAVVVARVARERCDPYCVFLGDAVAELQEGEYRSAVLRETQNPVWDTSRRRGQVPLLWLADTTAAVLRRRHLTITVMDADAGVTDDVVGSVVVWLGAGWRAEAEAGIEVEQGKGEGGALCAADDDDNKNKNKNNRNNDDVVATAAFELPILHRGRPRGWLRGHYNILDRRRKREGKF